MRTRPTEPTLSRGDVWSLWLFIAAGAAIAAFTLINGISRIVELVGNANVTVPAVFQGTRAEAPIGPDGELIEVELDRAVLTVEALPAASVGAGVLEAVTVMLATTTVVVLLILLNRELVRGRIFSRRNTKLATSAGFVWLAGVVLAPALGNMVANGAFARVSDRTFNNVVMSVDLQTLVFSAFVVAFIASIFMVGARLQRDQEGLV